MDVLISGIFHEKAAVQIHSQGHSNNCIFLAPGNIHGLYRSVKDQTIISQLKNKQKPKNQINMDIIMTIVYVLCFIVVFWIFFKTVNYFEKI